MTNEERKELLRKARPISFKTEAVKAILDGSKTTLRRVISLQLPEPDLELKGFLDTGNGYFSKTCNKGIYIYTRPCPWRVGNVLYVQETWRHFLGVHSGIDKVVRDGDDSSSEYEYKATPITDPTDRADKWHNAVHMPKQAARIFLKITDISAERIQDITDDAIAAEGIKSFYNHFPDKPPFVVPDLGSEVFPTRKKAYEAFWNSTLKTKEKEYYGWESNPYVWIVKFERIV